MAQKRAQQIESMEHVPAGELGGGFPPFQKETFASQFFWLVLVFVTLYLLMSRIALPRIGAIFEQRRQQIEADLAAAQRLKTDSDAAIAAYEKTLADARGRAQMLANDMRRKEIAEAEALRKELDSKLSARIVEAERIIAEAQAAAMTNVRGIATEAATAIIERLTGKRPPSQDVAAVIRDVLKS